MAVVLQIGAGGVGGVVAHKMAQNREVFSRIILASRTLSKCKAIADSIRAKGLGEIEIDEVDADNVESLVALINKYRPKVVVNVALPYQDLSIMEACLRTKTHYLDTANYEHPDSAHFEYKEQWAYDTRYKEAGIYALLGSGFDPGVTNVFCAYAQKHYFDEIHSIDILDCNAGDHGYAFATNFNPEINLREVSSKARFWVKDSKSQYAQNFDLSRDSIYRKFEAKEKHFKLESNTQDLKNEPYFNGEWRDIPPLALMKEWDYPEVGVKNSYLLYHEELESLVRNIRGLKRIRFFMTFGESYLTHMKCLENVGLLRVDSVEHKGQKIVPIEVLKTLLPDPASLASRTKGKTNIGCYIKGVKEGKERTIYIYNVCEHEKCYAEVNAQGVSYTTGVPAMIGAKLICQGKWGVGANSVCSDFLRSASDTLLRSMSNTPHSLTSHNLKNSSTTLEFADLKESYNAERLEANKDMPKGGEAQGVDSKSGAGVWNMEQNDPDPFMRELNKQGLPYVVLEIGENGESKVLEDGREKC
ncbi:saccharopine dehydrogenase family protein [Helicobacter typhlonius]|uniref:saccharopine dehydrogenase family protein n=2 Tax=Helicobacter typhlonius TaxID=76936 RepID=UPI002FDF6CA7